MDLFHPFLLAINMYIMNELNEDLYVVTGWSLIDITDTGDITSSDSKYRNQNRNWETLKQVLGLRAQITILSVPAILELDIGKLNFGPQYKGKQFVWSFKFGVEKPEVYGANFASLAKDFEYVPVLTGLAETVKIDTPLFVASGKQSNIYFE